MMDKVSLFLKAAVGEENIESYLFHDHWVEFATRSLGSILKDYESFLEQDTRDGWWTCTRCGNVNIDRYKECVECGDEKC